MKKAEISAQASFQVEKCGLDFLLLTSASMKDDTGRSTFPDTYGGGIGIERTIYTLCRGPKVEKIDDVTFFGKNPDSHQIYLF